MKNTETDSSAAASAAPAPTSAPARYDSGVKYGEAHYVVDPSTPPVNDGGVVRFAPSEMNDAQLVAFATTENSAITGNPGFTTPLPAVADVSAAITALAAAVETTRLARIALNDAVTAELPLRQMLQLLMKNRASYVQTASNGNTNLIVSAGFEVRRAPVPVGPLSPPTDLSLELNGTAGYMALRWSPTPNARAYNIQCSLANTMERNWQAYETTTASRYRCEDMTLGQVYAFRIAAVGGSTGQSDWSAEVVRMAA